NLFAQKKTRRRERGRVERRLRPAGQRAETGLIRSWLRLQRRQRLLLRLQLLPAQRPGPLQRRSFQLRGLHAQRERLRVRWLRSCGYGRWSIRKYEPTYRDGRADSTAWRDAPYRA